MESQVESIKAQMAAPDLVFLTDENQERIKESIAPEVYEAKIAELELKKKEAMAPPAAPRGVKGDLKLAVEKENLQ